MRWLKGINSSSSNKVFGQLALRCQFSFCVFSFYFVFFFACNWSLSAIERVRCLACVSSSMDMCDATQRHTTQRPWQWYTTHSSNRLHFYLALRRKKKKRFLSGEDSVAHFFVGLLFLLIISILRRFVYRYADFLLIVIISANLRDGCSFICFTYS